MAVIVVNGTSIQAAHDGAQPGDTLDVKAGGYGKLRLNKRLNIIGAGVGATKLNGTDPASSVIDMTAAAAGSVIKGLTSIGVIPADPLAFPLHQAAILVRGHDMTIEDVEAANGPSYGVRQYQVDRLTMRRVDIHHAALGVEVHGPGGGGSYAEDVVVHDINRVVLDDPGGYGGDAWHWIGASFTGTYRLLRPKVYGTRARITKASWGWDGGAFQGFGSCGQVIIEDFEVRDSVNVCETGTSDAHQRKVPTGWIFRNGDIYGAPGPVALTHEKACVGFFLRANNNFLIEKNRFHDVDWYAFMLASGGSYGSEMLGNQVVDNDFWLKRDMPEARYITVGAGVDMTKFGTIDRNRIHFDPARTPGGVAYVTGQNKTSDVNQFRSWTPWGDNDSWGPYVVTPPPPPPPPVDPCQAVKNELVQVKDELAQVRSALATAEARITAKDNHMKEGLAQ